MELSPQHTEQVGPVNRVENCLGKQPPTPRSPGRSRTFGQPLLGVWSNSSFQGACRGLRGSARAQVMPSRATWSTAQTPARRSSHLRPEDSPIYPAGCEGDSTAHLGMPGELHNALQSLRSPRFTHLREFAHDLQDQLRLDPGVPTAQSDSRSPGQVPEKAGEVCPALAGSQMAVDKKWLKPGNSLFQ